MKRILILSVVLLGVLLGGAANSLANTVTFTEILLDDLEPFTNQYAAYNLNGINDYYYIDSRDMFDQHGVANADTQGIIQFLTPVDSLSIDYLLVNQVFATFEIFDPNHHSLGVFMDDASNGDKNASYDFGGTDIAELDFSGTPNSIGVSTLRFTEEVPEPSSILLFGTSVAGAVSVIRRKLRP
jgi:hypothetical protein